LEESYKKRRIIEDGNIKEKKEERCYGKEYKSSPLPGRIIESSMFVRIT